MPLPDYLAQVSAPATATTKNCTNCLYLRLHETKPFSDYGHCKQGHDVSIMFDMNCTGWRAIEAF